MDDKTEIADIISRGPENTVSDGPARDDKGRFAKSEPEPTPAPEPTGEIKAEPAPVQPAPSAPPAEAPSQPPPGYVPLAALVDVRLEAKLAKQRAAQIERELEELRRPKADPVDFFADPEAAFAQRAQGMLHPLQQKLQELQVTLLEERLFRVAGDRASKIQQEIANAMESGDPDIPLLANALRTQGAGGVDMLVKWYDKRTFDPATEREKLKAELLAELQGQAPPQKQVQATPALPSNLAGARNVGTRAGPSWAGPTPLTDIFARK